MKCRSYPRITPPDIPVEFVADPFMLRVCGTWHMFFEAMNARTDKGNIGLATSSNGQDWKYEQFVLAESFHLAPCNPVQNSSVGDAKDQQHLLVKAHLVWRRV